jgi:Phage integrase, N-terminal SAM-like domain
VARPKRDAGGYFNVTITIGQDATGKRIRSKTLARLRAKQEAALGEKSQGKLTTGLKPPLSEFLSDWLEQVVKVENRPRTYERYECDVRNHIVPRLGHRRPRLSGVHGFCVWARAPGAGSGGRCRAGRAVYL